jgi:para-aminobenzoate synthetase component 1
MASLRRIPLAYQRDSSQLFAKLRHLPNAVFLDSAAAYSEHGRFDIICADPEELFALNTINYVTKDKLLIELESRLEQISCEYIPAPGLPFSGGALGYLSYEFGEMHSAKLLPSNNVSTQPLLYIGIYSWAVIIDHDRQHSELISQPHTCPRKLTALGERLTAQETTIKPSSAFKVSRDFGSSLNFEDYSRAFTKIKTYIDAGDCYQINLTRAFYSQYQGDPWLAYLRLREVAAAPFSAYMDIGGSQILCLSPERLLSAQQGRLLTQPIKGTAPRSLDAQEDMTLANTLLASAKNRAENVMIVDLLRNDFSKSCQPDSVDTERLCELQSFKTVHHLVSTITGRLRNDCSAFSALLSCFPGGSITGAPKQRAMEIIREIEPHSRSVYCGSIFYLGAGGEMDSNIAIRSFVCEDGSITAWAGGGIVADSELNEEFVETETKIGKLLKALTDL